MSSAFYLQPFNFLDVSDTPKMLVARCACASRLKNHFSPLLITCTIISHRARAAVTQMNERVSKLRRALSDEQDANILLSLAQLTRDALTRSNKTKKRA
jgi:hypothetical protein